MLRMFSMFCLILVVSSASAGLVPLSPDSVMHRYTVDNRTCLGFIGSFDVGLLDIRLYDDRECSGRFVALSVLRHASKLILLPDAADHRPDSGQSYHRRWTGIRVVKVFITAGTSGRESVAIYYRLVGAQSLPELIFFNSNEARYVGSAVLRE